MSMYYMIACNYMNYMKIRVIFSYMDSMMLMHASDGSAAAQLLCSAALAVRHTRRPAGTVQLGLVW